MDTPTLVQSDVTCRRIFAYQAHSKQTKQKKPGDEASARYIEVSYGQRFIMIFMALGFVTVCSIAVKLGA